MMILEEEKGQLGPHNDCEFALMRSGKKQVAYFSMEIPDDFFDAEINYPFIKKLCLADKDMHIYYLENYEAKAQYLAEKIQEAHDKGFVREIEAEIGRLLGYTEEDIMFYLQHIEKRNLLK